ncbi:uncharacterized protein LOC119767389 [Culex quinquefasciatus]|uniref:uncharacterized protein LOC119767389 n=1 Tax=Culex quinquefasciatus TaxID=7176 RepID=UPI0018E3C166|nr:uncharacterized protein LOC119767389 [Culex quinquefasciatus]
MKLEGAKMTEWHENLVSGEFLAQGADPVVARYADQSGDIRKVRTARRTKVAHLPHDGVRLEELTDLHNRNLDAVSCNEENINSDFHLYNTASKTWFLICRDTAQVGTPPDFNRRGQADDQRVWRSDPGTEK